MTVVERLDQLPTVDGIEKITLTSSTGETLDVTEFDQSTLRIYNHILCGLSGPVSLLKACQGVYELTEFYEQQDIDYSDNPVIDMLENVRDQKYRLHAEIVYRAG